jgi:hypothetical protein
LSELGYYPGIVPTLAKVEREVALLKADNVKMFEDNRSLAQLISHQNERLAYANARDPDRVALYEQARCDLLAVTAERDALRAQVLALQSRPDVLSYQKTITDLEQTRALLNNALAEVARLQQLQQPFVARKYFFSHQINCSRIE